MMSKSTVMIVSGLLKPSEGAVYFRGHALQKNMSEVRKDISFSSSHNVLFDSLTVEEHLIFYSSVRDLIQCIIFRRLWNILML